VGNAEAVMAWLEKRYEDAAIGIDHLDGLSVEFDDWRFNIRASNTEPLLRLNVETLGNPALLKKRVNEVAKAVSIAAFWSEWSRVA